MIIAEKLNLIYQNQVEIIKKETNYSSKIRQIGALIMSLGDRAINAVAKIVGCSWRFAKKCYKIVNNKLDIISNRHNSGRKKIEDKNPEIVNQIKTICENFENVDKSLKDDIVYVDITAKNVIEKLKSDYNYEEKDCPSENTIIRIFREKLGYKITKVKKNKVLKKIPETDAIFANVNKKKEEVKSSDNFLSYSIDDKTTKYIGNLSENGSSWKEKEAEDHDTNKLGAVKPFGICNTKTNEVNVYCTKNSSTAEFKADCLEKQINKDLKKNPKISKIFLFLDNGPENSSRRTLWIWCMIMMAIKLNITIELVYYPPYHSKYNLIEHFWGVLQRSWNGLIINNTKKLIGAINGTKWSGINAKGILVKKKYKKGKTIDKKELENLVKKHVHYENKGIEKWSLIITP